MDKTKKQNNFLFKLLEDTPEAYYWTGFIMADGHITKDNRLVVILSNKDENHLKKLGKYLNCNVRQGKFKKYKISILSVMDVKMMPKIIEKFDINNLKTLNPPKFNSSNENLFSSFFIGFIDGDGRLVKLNNRDFSVLIIKCHKNWKDTLTKWVNKIYKFAHIKNLHSNHKNINECKINNCGYANINIANSKVLFYLKNKVIELKLPALERKWNNVPLKYSDRYEKAHKKKNNIIRDLRNGMRNKNLSSKYNISPSRISNIKKKFLCQKI